MMNSKEIDRRKRRASGSVSASVARLSLSYSQNFLICCIIAITTTKVSGFQLAAPSGHGTVLFANDKMSTTATQAQSTSKQTRIQVTPSNSISQQFKPRYIQYEQERLHGAALPEQNEMRTANPRTLPSEKERSQLTDKIARLLNFDAFEEDERDGHGVADKQTVHAKLSDMELREASDAVAKPLKNRAVDTDEKVRKIGFSTKKGKVTATVVETGKDTIQQYIKSISNHQVLSPEDELVLGRQIQMLQKWEAKREQLELSLSRAPTFTEWADCVGSTVPELKKQIRRSKRAKAALMEANMRLVVTVARQSVKRSRSEINFQDACQEGMVGLSRATEKFDPEKGFRFSTYATWWIKKMIIKNVTEQARPVKLPAKVMTMVNEIRISEKVLQDTLGRRPKDHEIADKVGITEEKLNFYRRSAQEVTSLDKKVQYKSEKSKESMNLPEVSELIKDTGNSPTENAQRQMLRDDVFQLIRTLSPREQAVIRLRFGLDDGTPKSLNEVAQKFKAEKDQIQTIEARALRKLRQPDRNRSLKSYMKDL